MMTKDCMMVSKNENHGMGVENDAIGNGMMINEYKLIPRNEKYDGMVDRDTKHGGMMTPKVENRDGMMVGAPAKDATSYNGIATMYNGTVVMTKNRNQDVMVEGARMIDMEMGNGVNVTVEMMTMAREK